METKISEIKKQISALNRLIDPYKLDYVEPGSIKLLDVNARYMTKDQLDRLTENIKEDGFLSQLPFCSKGKDGKYKALSGNHRIKAAIKSGQKYILILFTENLPENKQVAIQLSHNSISGQDDKKILADLYFKIDELALREYAFIDEKEIKQFDTSNLPPISEAYIDFIELNLVFCDYDYKLIDEVLKKLENVRFKEHKIFAWIDTDRFIDIMTEIKKKENIKNHSLAFLKMIEICNEWIRDNQ